MSALPIWASEIVDDAGPRYVAIAHAIERAVEKGMLRPGDKLPPHRDLARQLGLDVSTITRAYAEIKRRGLARAEVGRGTFVRRKKPDAPVSLWQPVAADGFIDLSHNFPATAPDNPAASALSEAWKAAPMTTELVGLQADAGHAAHREAMARWLEQQSGIVARPSDIVITAGAQHGVLLAIHAVTDPGDVVLCESITFYGALSAARFLGRRVEPVDIDGEGLIPAALDRAFASTGARALYCNPTLHNPTTAVMSLERREAIAEICRKYDAILIEDDVYGFLLHPRAKTLCSLAPERTLYVTGFSKITGPGLRVGVVRAPGHLVPRVSAGLRATCLMAPAPMVELVCRLLHSGDMDDMAQARLMQIAERQAWADEVLGETQVLRKPNSFHTWLRIGAWSSEAFSAVARERGVGVAPGALFHVGAEPRGNAAVRICISAAQDKANLQQALRVLSSLVAEGPHAARAIV